MLNIRSPIFLAVLISFFIALVNNQVLWLEFWQRGLWSSWQGSLYIVTFFLLLSTILLTLFLILSLPYLLKPVLIFFIILSALTRYFSQDLGVIFDVDMIRNLLDTIKDGNQQEAIELVSLPLLQHLLIYAFLPSLWIAFVRYPKQSVWFNLKARGLYLFVAFMLVTVLLLLNFQYVTYFSRENRDLRLYVTPLYALTSVYKTIRNQVKQQTRPFQVLGKDAQQATAAKKRKTVGIMVVGETARADHFSLNGYKRLTNPNLVNSSVISFDNVWACGTSTAFSVPCMFSFLDRQAYHPEKADKQSNLLDVLITAGVKVIWIDNNSSCKGVCARIPHFNLRDSPQPESKFYAHGQYYDEILLSEIDQYIDESQQDVLLVLHTLGSHGPAYSKRYPSTFAHFSPDCHENAPQLCSHEQIVNAYDNTLRYTDHLLSQFIDYLDNKGHDSFLFYASDHGESLGEKGIYLHGLPYFMAPDAQLHVPLIAWFSSGFSQHHGLNIDNIRQTRSQRYSHDNLSHSVLGLFGVETELYQSELDMFLPSS
jgi:lipid A ethanolaminephosphotransferase